MVMNHNGESSPESKVWFPLATNPKTPNFLPHLIKLLHSVFVPITARIPMLPDPLVLPQPLQIRIEPRITRRFPTSSEPIARRCRARRHRRRRQGRRVRMRELLKHRRPSIEVIQHGLAKNRPIFHVGSHAGKASFPIGPGRTGRDGGRFGRKREIDRPRSK